jgi:methionyl-tRNA formyltransferase
MYPMGVEMLAESVRMVREGNAPRITQDESQATYEGPADDTNSAIDWNRPAREVYDLIRGSNPQPGAHAILYATKVRIFDCTMTPHTGFPPVHAPGTIISSHATIDIALDGGVLHAKRLQRDGGAKSPAEHFAQEMGLEVDDAFENGVVEPSPEAAG